MYYNYKIVTKALINKMHNIFYVVN